MSILNDPSIKLLYMLDVDVMYYQLAKRQLEYAEDAKINSDKAERTLTETDWYIFHVMEQLGDEIDFSAVEEEFGLKSDHIERIQCEEIKLKTSYAEFFQALAATHIFCVAALEAHINLCAQYLIDARKLRMQEYEDFYWLRIREKWEKLPQQMGNDSFDKGRQPFQGFVELIKRRNALVHFSKDRSKSWYEIQGLIHNDEIGLDIDTARKSLHTVKAMVKALDTKLEHHLSGRKQSITFNDEYFDLKWGYSG